MPDIRDIYSEVEALDLPDLHTRREAINSRCQMKDDGTPDYNTLDDDSLSELLAVNRALRKKIAANTGTAKRTASPRAKAAKPSVDDLL